MKWIVTIIPILLAVSTSVLAQGGRGAAVPPPPLEPGASQADVDRALLAAPATLRNQAMVIKWSPDFTYDTRANAHMTVAVPGATTQSIGLPDNNKMGGAWIMNAGTSAAHIMVPGHSRSGWIR